MFIFFFFFNDTATTEIYTLSLHDALPIWGMKTGAAAGGCARKFTLIITASFSSTSASLEERSRFSRSEEHTSELQSLAYLVCRLLLEKKKKTTSTQRLMKLHSQSSCTVAS